MQALSQLSYTPEELICSWAQSPFKRVCEYRPSVCSLTMPTLRNGQSSQHRLAREEREYGID